MVSSVQPTEMMAMMLQPLIFIYQEEQDQKSHPHTFHGIRLTGVTWDACTGPSWGQFWTFRFLTCFLQLAIK